MSRFNGFLFSKLHLIGSAIFIISLSLLPVCRASSAPRLNRIFNPPVHPTTRVAPSFNSNPAAGAGGAFEYLNRVMDQYYDVFYVYFDDICGGNHFIPSGWMGDIADIGYFGNHTHEVFSGVSCNEIVYAASGSPETAWAGVYWQYPENNWGDKGNGYNLAGATALTFAAKGKIGGEQVEFKMGGINRNPDHNPSFPDQDSCDLLSTGIITLSNSWQEYAIDLVGTEYFRVFTEKNAGSNNHYIPSGWLNGSNNMSFDGGWTENPHGGGTCIRVEWNGEAGADGYLWNGIDWQYPEGNWFGNNGKGYDLTGATKLSFYARTDQPGLQLKFWVGYPGDSCGEVFITAANQHFVEITGNWSRYEIDLSGRDMSDVCCGFGFAFNDVHDPNPNGCVFYLDDITFDKPLKKDLSNILGGFCYAVDKAHNPDGCTFYVDDVKYDKAVPETIHFLQSYTYNAQTGDNYIRNAAFVYDNALALIAYSMPGPYRNLPRAKRLADAFVTAQMSDRYFSDGRLRNAYMCGDLIDPATGYAKLPGWWDYGDESWYEDAGSDGTSAGNMAWGMIALMHYYQQRGGRQYLDAALEMAEWVVANCYSDIGAGGFTGGYNGFDGNQVKLTWKSVEHNIDLYIAFSLLSRWDQGWSDDAQHAWSFVEAMWNETTGHFWTGTKEDGVTINDTSYQIPLDAQAWSVLASPESNEYHRALAWAREHLWVEDADCPSVISGYDFNPDRDGVWFEGVGQMGVVYQVIGDQAHADECLAALRAIQTESPLCAGTGIPAACKDGLTTGFDWVYNARCCLAATCWYIFAEEAYNPYSPPPPQALILGGSDYNGNGASDVAVFRPSIGFWAIRGITGIYFGSDFDLPVCGDYNGDDTADIGIFRDTSSFWAIRNVTHLYFGSATDIAVPGDYNGDGSCDTGIFRASSGFWAIRGVTRVYFGGGGDMVGPGDYNGDGTKDLALFRGSSGLWALRDITRVYLGASGDRVTPGDYNGDGTWEPGIFRPASGLWYIRDATRMYFGAGSDYPVPADYNGDSKDDVGIFRDDSGLWAVRRLSRIYYGNTNDIPVTR